MHLIDAHVHIHPAFDLGHFLDAAVENFQRCAPAGGHGPGCLLLAESSGTDAFDALERAATGRGCTAQVQGACAVGWSFRTTDDAEALVASRDGTPLLFIIAGHQIVAGGRLEVLGLLTRQRFPAGLSLVGAIDAVHEAAGIPVLPWGFGKWTLARGRQVQAALAEGRRPLFAGDNGGRPERSPEPVALRRARQDGIPVLPGSDPLPFRHEEGRAGSYGFIADCDIPAASPAAALRQWLNTLADSPPTFGRRVGVARFLYNQAAMQVGRRLGSGTAP